MLPDCEWVATTAPPSPATSLARSWLDQVSAPLIVLGVQGAVGFFGYDLVRAVEPLDPAGPDPLGLPDMALMLSDALVVFDHLKHTVTILANADLQREPDVGRAYAAAERTIAEIRSAIAGPVPRERPVAAGERPIPEFTSIVFLRDGSFCRCQEYGSCPTSLVLLFQSGGALDQSALTGCERNAQVIILSFFRVFTLSSHSGSLTKEMSIP